MENKTIVIVITVIVGLIGFSIMLSGLYNKNVPENKIEVSNTSESTTSSIIITTNKKEPKKVLKTTKKINKKNNNKMNVKASKDEMINYAHQQVITKWGEEHWQSFYQLVSHESGWNANSVNKKTGACGLFQFVPCSKGGKAYKTDYKVQIQKGIAYISARYGNPNNAWKFWQKHHWY